MLSFDGTALAGTSRSACTLVTEIEIVCFARYCFFRRSNLRCGIPTSSTEFVECNKLVVVHVTNRCVQRCSQGIHVGVYFIEQLVAIASTGRTSPSTVGLRSVQRSVIRMDPVRQSLDPSAALYVPWIVPQCFFSFSFVCTVWFLGVCRWSLRSKRRRQLWCVRRSSTSWFQHFLLRRYDLVLTKTHPGFFFVGVSVFRSD